MCACKTDEWWQISDIFCIQPFVPEKKRQIYCIHGHLVVFMHIFRFNIGFFGSYSIILCSFFNFFSSSEKWKLFLAKGVSEVYTLELFDVIEHCKCSKISTELNGSINSMIKATFYSVLCFCTIMYSFKPKKSTFPVLRLTLTLMVL